MENKKNAKPFSDGKFSVSMHLRPKSDLAWSVHNAKRKLDHTLSPLWLTPFFLSYNRNRAFCKEKSYVSPVFLLLWADNRGAAPVQWKQHDKPQYVTARFSAYRNVWWSLANEYDLMTHKTVEDWEHYAQLLCEKDPYHHLRSIHNCIHFYDHTRPWITHCSIQRQDLYKSAELTEEWRERYRKPVVLDEIAYEGISSTDGETSAGKS